MKKYREPKNIAMVSIITSSRSDLQVDYSQDIDIVSFCLIKLSDPSKKYIGHSFDELLDSINEMKSQLIYVDDLNFVAPYIVNQFIKRNYQLYNGVDIYNKISIGQFKIFNHNNNYYYIGYKLPNMSGRYIEFKNAFEMIRMKGSTLVSIDYTKLNKNNIEYCSKKCCDICSLISPILNRLVLDGCSRSVSIGQYSYSKLISYVKNSKKLFPTISDELNSIFREGYRGGVIYCADRFKHEIVYNVKAYDCNKMFSSMMYKHKFPCHHPIEIEASNKLKAIGCKLLYNNSLHKFKLVNDSNKLFIAECVVVCKVEKNHIPCFDERGLDSLGGGTGEFNDRIISSSMIFTSVDLDTLFENYIFPNVASFYINRLWVFDKCEPFNEFVEHYYTECNLYKRGTPDYVVSKLILECGYGKFGSKNIKSNNRLIQNGNEYKYIDCEEDNSVMSYLPVAMFITSYARQFITRLATLNYNNLVYIDTDSIHLINNATPVGIVVGGGLGQFKIESVEDVAVYNGPKVYSYKNEDGVVVKASGLNVSSKNISNINVEQLISGVTVNNIVKYKCAGGYAYYSRNYSI